MDYLWTGLKKVHKNYVIRKNIQNVKIPQTLVKSSFFKIHKTLQKL